MRALFFAILLLTATSAAALADASVAGNWHASLGSGVTINMHVTADGKWTSQTLQRSKIVRQIRGTYKQEPSNENAGTIVFTPTQSSAKSGGAEVETDQYEIAENGRQLKLTTGGDTMVFEKRKHH